MIDGLSALDLARVCHVQSEVAQAWLDRTETPNEATLARLRLVQGVMERLAKNGIDDADDRVWVRLSGVVIGLAYAALVLTLTRSLTAHEREPAAPIAA